MLEDEIRRLSDNLESLSYFLSLLLDRFEFILENSESNIVEFPNGGLKNE